MRYVLLITLVLGCPSASDDDDSADDVAVDEIVPPPGCEAAFAGERAMSLLEGLDAVGSLRSPYWLNFEASDSPVILFETVEAGTCALLHRGDVQAYGLLPEPPTMLTPLFGYLLPWSDGPEWIQPLADAAVQPDCWASWAAEQGLDRAAIVPAEVPEDLTFDLSALSHLQIAVHEGFHVEVQTGAWFEDPSHPWPSWDQQPARSQLSACYADPGLAKEQEMLAFAVGEVWAGEIDGACAEYGTFLNVRAARRAALDTVRIAAADGVSELSCAEAEAILELEEGTAEFMAWAQLRDAGQATEGDVRGSLFATTTEPFYKFGAGQLFLLFAFDPEGVPDHLAAIADSASSEIGSIEAVAAEAIDRFCP